ncbi:MAG: DUF7005 family protein [Xenococcaceae cyanobacterium]
MKNRQFRTEILTAFGASALEIDELLDYNQNIFDCVARPKGDRVAWALPNRSSLNFSLQFPLRSEPHLPVWEEYISEASAIGAFKTLQSVLVQLKFPIQKGISQSSAYRAATLRGVATKDCAEATGLILKQPEKLQLQTYSSLAGAIPTIFTGDREDFVSLVQALTKRNEPVTIPNSMGACLVAGYNNWDRIDRYRRQWHRQNTGDRTEAAWQEEFQRLIKQKELYQDRFIIASDGFYSGVSASALGMSESLWLSLSLTIRLEHESTHYFTRRLFNSMQNNLLDELIADYRGIVAVNSYYRADWFLHFLGLESSHYREGGRMQNYRGQPPLSDRAFTILQALVKAAAKNLECFDRQRTKIFNTRYFSPSELAREQALTIAGLCDLTLEELASDEMHIRLQNSLEGFRYRSKVVNQR